MTDKKDKKKKESDQPIYCMIAPAKIGIGFCLQFSRNPMKQIISVDRPTTYPTYDHARNAATEMVKETKGIRIAGFYTAELVEHKSYDDRCRDKMAEDLIAKQAGSLLTVTSSLDRRVY